MEKYFISYYVNVYEDSYTHGECENINNYSGSGLINATDAVNAVKLFFNNELCFELENIEKIQDEQINCFNNSVFYS